jgi:prolyl-tRNA synthetase
MRMSQLFSTTRREDPVEAELDSHRLLVRAGYIRQLASGIFTLLPLGQRVADRISTIIREEMDAIGGQEISMPVVHPGDLWKETGRFQAIGEELTRFRDRGQRDMVLAMTHEEVVADLVRKEIASYRQLPQLIYQLQTKWRDEPRPRGGLIRTREFVMKDSYSLDRDAAGLDAQYRAHYQAYHRIYGRCDLPVIAVQSDTGMMGGQMAHEFMYLTADGEDTLLINEEHGYAANQEVAAFRKPAATPEAPRPLERIATPNTTTIEALAGLLGIPRARTAKAVFLAATMQDGGERQVFAVLRGDMDLNEIKLARVTGAVAMRPATEAEIRAIGAEPGYASPIGVKGCLVVADDALVDSPNLVAGANEAGYHLANVNYGRDFAADIVADIALAREGDQLPTGEGLYQAARGVEVGNIFKLGTRYSEALGANYLDQDGESHPVLMGSYGIGIGRLMACIAQAHHDEGGLAWPVTVAPYEIHMVVLPGGAAEEAAESLYADLRRAGWQVLLDDRDERAGVKFNDADLIGVPLRLTVSKRSLEAGGVECRLRTSPDREIIELAAVPGAVRQKLEALRGAIAASVEVVAGQAPALP